MIEVRNNFKSKYEEKNENLLCEVCQSHVDTQNLFECPSLNMQQISGSILYRDIFSNDMQKNEAVIEALSSLLEQREIIINERSYPTH